LSAITSALLDCAEGWQPLGSEEEPMVCGACLTINHPRLRLCNHVFVFGEIDCADDIYGWPGQVLPESERDKLRDLAQHEVLLGGACQ
jgi:hypothetical protein